MRWFSGDIAEAIKVSKSKGAVFVVYIEGKDEKSQQISKLIETEEVGSKLGSEQFVAIRVEAGSLSHQQFSEFYKETPVPSIYFIGKLGLPVKIITEATDASSLNKDLDAVLSNAGVNVAPTPSSSSAASASASLINAEQEKPKPPNVVCENGVCTIKKPSEPVVQPSVSPPEGDQSGVSAEEKIERAKKLLEAKRLEKEREEKENEKQKELERRKMGQEVQKLKKWQEDQDFKQLVEEREKEKRLEKEHRDRVLAQIAQDKAERIAKFQPAASSTPTNKDAPQPTPSTSRPDSNTARLQFKLSDGTSKTQDFPSSDKLISVINFVKTNFNLATNKFTLSTTFPRKQFTESDHSQTLSELQLTPNAVLLVLPLNQGVVSTNQGPGGFVGFIWTLLAPLLGILNFIKIFLGFGNTGQVSGDQPSSSGYSSGGSRSNGVVHVRSKYDLENRLKSAGSKLVVIDFFATWCGPCKMIAPELERMAKDFPGVVFLKVDVDENGDISREYSVSAMPTFVFLKNRREVSRIRGADSYSLRSTIQRYK